MFCASILRPFKQSCVYTFKKRIYGYTIYTYILYIRRKIVGQQKHLVIAEACNATLTTWQLLFETRSPSVGTWSKALRLRQAPSRSRWIVYLVTEADGWFLLDGRFIAMDGYKIQLTEVVAPMIYRVCTCLYGIPGSAGFLIINSMHIMYFIYIYTHQPPISWIKDLLGGFFFTTKQNGGFGFLVLLRDASKNCPEGVRPPSQI